MICSGFAFEAMVTEAPDIGKLFWIDTTLTCKSPREESAFAVCAARRRFMGNLLFS